MPYDARYNTRDVHQNETNKMHAEAWVHRIRAQARGAGAVQAWCEQIAVYGESGRGAG